MILTIFLPVLLPLSEARVQERAGGIMTAIGAQPATVTYDRDDPNNCGFGAISAESWRNNDIDGWFSEKTRSGVLTGNLSSALGNEYAPNLAQSIFVCDVDSICTVSHFL